MLALRNAAEVMARMRAEVEKTPRAQRAAMRARNEELISAAERVGLEAMILLNVDERRHSLVTGDVARGLEAAEAQVTARNLLNEKKDQSQTGNAQNSGNLVDTEYSNYDIRDLSGNIMDEAAKACKPAADYFGLPVEVVRETLAELRAKAAREMTARATAEPRLKWGQDNAPDENPAAFAWRAYQAEAKAGTLHRGLIAQEDKPLSVKLANWLRTHPMPEGVDIPTLPEWNTRQLAKLEGGEADVMRLYGVARRRRDKIPSPANN